MSFSDDVRAYYGAALPFYDASLADRGDLPFWSSIARRWQPANILELGCGTGRVTTILSNQAPTTGSDLLIEMIARAARHAPDAQFVAADLRDFSFATTFDLIVLADDPMSHLLRSEERSRALAGIAHHLSSGGRVVIEGLYRSADRLPVSPARRVHDFTVTESWVSRGDAVWHATYRYQRGATITETTTNLRSWTVDETNQLPQVGLKLESLLGDFDERPFSSGSPRIVIVARRAAAHV
jgi:SAM-dependent methyltransferase